MTLFDDEPEPISLSPAEPPLFGPYTARGIHLMRGERIIATVGGPNCPLTLLEARTLAAGIAAALNATQPRSG